MKNADASYNIKNVNTSSKDNKNFKENIKNFNKTFIILFCFIKL